MGFFVCLVAFVNVKYCCFAGWFNAHNAVVSSQEHNGRLWRKLNRGQQIVEGQTAPEQHNPSKINQVVAKGVRRFCNKYKLQNLLQWQTQPLQKKRTKHMSALFFFYFQNLGGVVAKTKL